MKVTRRELWTALSLYGDPKANDLNLKEPGPMRKHHAPEQGILHAVIAALRLHPRVAWVARINTGAFKTTEGRFIRFGFPGCPDIIGQMKDGRILMIECKSERGVVTTEQQAIIEKVKANHGVAGIARSVQDALDIVSGE